MQRAFKTAMPYKPVPEKDARFSEDELYLMSLELLEFLLAIEEEIGLKVASDDLPDSALESLSALYSHIKGLSVARAAN
jgi:acyl carrier protein